MTGVAGHPDLMELFPYPHADLRRIVRRTLVDQGALATAGRLFLQLLAPGAMVQNQLVLGHVGSSVEWVLARTSTLALIGQSTRVLTSLARCPVQGMLTRTLSGTGPARLARSATWQERSNSPLHPLQGQA
jgi:hypothetical protein